MSILSSFDWSGTLTNRSKNFTVPLGERYALMTRTERKLSSRCSFLTLSAKDCCFFATARVLLWNTLWVVRESNSRPSACKADALNHLS
jgi:hypothetical protein